MSEVTVYYVNFVAFVLYVFVSQFRRYALLKDG